jgi:maltose O-acetyltransferase
VTLRERLRDELVAWTIAAARNVPGRIGIRLRNAVVPYTHGTGVVVREGVHIDRPGLLVMGDNVSINRRCVINAEGGIHIGDDVLVGPGVILYSQNHRFGSIDRPIRAQGYAKVPVVIEADVWLAAGVIVLPGVTVGRGSVIGAGSVVTKDVPPGSVAVGNPARVIRSRDAH